MKINRYVSVLNSSSVCFNLFTTSKAIKKYKLISLLLTLTVFLIVSPKAFADSVAAKAFDQESATSSIAALPASTLKSQLKNIPGNAQIKALNLLQTYSVPTADIPSLRVNSDGSIYYVEPAFNSNDQSVAEQLLTANAMGLTDFTESVVFSLHSNPSASNKVYIDVNGEVLSGSAWSSDALYAAPFDLDADEETFNSSELKAIANIWHRVSEDMAPFNIDVTTEDPVTFGPNIGHILITKDIDESGADMPWVGWGGVATIGAWGWADYEFYQPALVYYNNLSFRIEYIAEAATHELGHNLGLYHDGTSSVTYYGGHGSGNTGWRPIMGNSYRGQVTQWSKGEYADANNQQDDIQILTDLLGLRLDDHGNTITTASDLLFVRDKLSTTNQQSDPYNLSPENKGIISHRNDIDVFEFQVTEQSIANFSVNPSWDAFNEQYRGSNLDIGITLYRSDGSLITSVDAQYDTNSILNLNLDQGVYYLSVTGSGSNNYSDYGSLGQYFINGSLRAIGKPSIDRSSDVGLFIWENSKNNWVANVVSGDQQRIVEFDVISDQPVSKVVPLSIESNDVFTQLPNSLDMSLNVQAPWMDGVKFTSFDQSNTCVSTANTDIPVYLGTNRVQMPAAFDLSTLAGCERLSVKTIGKPSIDRSSDVGLFIWENTKNNWIANIVSADKQRIVEFDVLSDQPVSNAGISIESNDVFTQLSNGFEMSLNVQAPWMDGVKFTSIDQSNTCVSTANADVPIYLGPNRVQMPAAFDLRTLTGCERSSVNTLGKPSIDRSSDNGVFIWENFQHQWQAEVVSADNSQRVDINVGSSQNLTNVQQVNIESTDVFTVLPKRLELQLNVSAPWMDGLKFTEMDHSHTCIETTAIDFPIYVGPNRVNMGSAINLATFMGC